MQQRLLPFAIASFMAYTVGFPLILALVLIKHRKLIYEDQARTCPYHTEVHLNDLCCKRRVLRHRFIKGEDHVAASLQVWNCDEGNAEH